MNVFAPALPARSALWLVLRLSPWPHGCLTGRQQDLDSRVLQLRLWGKKKKKKEESFFVSEGLALNRIPLSEVFCLVLSTSAQRRRWLMP